MISEDDLVWIEKFYSDLEHGLTNYLRPKDYIERALRVINGTRNPVKFNKEGHNRSGDKSLYENF